MFIKLRLNLKLPSTILEADKIAYIQGWISPPGYRAIARWAPSGGGGGGASRNGSHITKNS